MKLLSLMLISCLTTVAISQNTTNSNRAIHRTWGGDKIRLLEQQHPAFLEKGLYYFNQSYEVRLKDCSSCEVDRNKLINIDLFNVSDFELKRADEERYEFNFKYYVITLHSNQELESYLGINRFLIMNGEGVEVAFPTFDFSDLSAKKMEKYRELCQNYVRFYKTSYKQRTTVPGYRIFTLNEVKNFSQLEIEQLENTQNLFEVSVN